MLDSANIRCYSTDRTKEERKRIKGMKQTAFIDDSKSGILKF